MVLTFATWGAMGSSDADQIKESPKEYVTAFDVPALFELSVDEVTTALGDIEITDDSEPTTTQMNAGVDLWDKVYTKNGFSLSAYYDPRTRVVKYFMFSKLDGSTEDPVELLKAAGVELEAAGYVVAKTTVFGDEKQIASITIDPLTIAEKEAMAALAEQRKSFDRTFGNNPEASYVAKTAYDALKASGALTDNIYLEITSDGESEQAYLLGGSEDEYAESVTIANLTVGASPAAWSYASQSAQKDFTASLYQLIHGRYPNAITHVKVSNGVREVATADTSWLGEMKIELK